MTATVYTSTADAAAIQAVLTANYTAPQRIEFEIKGNTAYIIIYDNS